MQVELHPLDPHQSGVHGRRLYVILNGELVNVSALSRRIGLNQSYVSKILSGKIYPARQNLAKIAWGLGMTPGELIDSIEYRRTA
jgi:transcriptional regulator with XRE-family HTH domain